MQVNSGSMVRHFSKWIFLVSLLLAAVLSLSGRLLIHNIEYFKSSIEQELAQYGITGVSLDSIEGGWQGLHPLLKIQGASLSIPGRSQALSINELELSVKLIPSLVNKDLKLESLHTTIEKLILVQDTGGVWWLNDIPLNTTTSGSDSKLDIYALFQQLPDFVSVDIRLIQIRDLLNDHEYVIQASSLRSSRIKEQLSLALDAYLPRSLGGRFQVFVNGDQDYQKLFVEAKNLNLVEWLQLSGFKNEHLSQARVSFRSWGDMIRFKISELQNQVNITQLRLKKYATGGPSGHVTFQQQVMQRNKNWRINTRVDQLSWNKRTLPNFNAQLLLAHDSDKPLLWVDALNVSDVLPVLEDVLDEGELKQTLSHLNPSADIHNLVAEIDFTQPENTMFGLDINNFRSAAFQAIPAIDKVNGRLISNIKNAHLDLHSDQLQLDFEKLFRQPLEFNKFSTSLSIVNSADGLLVDVSELNVSNADISASAHARIEAKQGAKPFMALRAQYENGQVASTSKYLPVSIMPEGVVRWLDRSIKSGEITQGDLLFHGRFNKLSELEAKGSGVFSTVLEVNDPQVQFLSDWPVASQGQGEVSFRNLAMNIDMKKAEVASLVVDQANIKIPNLLKSELLIHASTRADAKEVLDSLSEMPILPIIDEIKNKASKVDGMVKGNVNLRFPLSSRVQRKRHIEVNAELEQASLAIPAWMVDLSKLEGRVNIKNGNISAQNLNTLYYGEPARLNINSDTKNNRTEFRVNGKLDSHSLTQLLPPYLQHPVQGKSVWDIKVSTANDLAADKPLMTFIAESDLQGTEVNMPEPLKVKKRQSEKFMVTGSLSKDNQFKYQATLTDKVVVDGSVLLDDKSYQREYLHVHFGRDSQDKLVKDINLTGHIKELNVNHWSQYITHQFDEDSLHSESILSQLQLTDVTIDQLTWGNQQAKDAHITMTNQGDMLSGEIDSSLAKGRFKLPYNMDPAHPFEADLDYIRLQKSDLDNDLNPDIEQMPNLDIESKEISYESMNFSDFILKTENTKGRFNIKQLDFQRDEVTLKSSGHWQLMPQNNEHVSVFNIAIKGENFGKAVSGLGLGETIRGGEVDFKGQIGWGGSLYDINWPTLIGEVQLNLENGYLRNVDPGAGRFVGLLSFNALPKRLFLDFGDVVREGMQFDKIKGRFSINGEIMSTDNASMDGTSARVKLKGRTNLREQTYDQIMIIIPKVGDTLPVLGSLAAGNAVGWGLLLLQKIFKKPIDKSVEIEYAVTGSWEDPQIELVTQPEPVTKPEPFKDFEDFRSNDNS